MMQIVSTTDGQFIGLTFDPSQPIILGGAVFTPDRVIAIGGGISRFSNSSYVFDAIEV